MMPIVVKEEKMEEKENEVDKGEMIDDGDKNEDKKGETNPGDGDGEKESSSQAPAEKLALPAQVKEKKQVFNLNNEVVNMRKEVKRVRALIIRKLARQIKELKKKKGIEEEVEKNQRKATRLLKEIHSMKKLRPDQVTKTALRRTLNFEKVCKNPRSTMSDRALAHIATHRQFDEKIQNLKAAVAAFKEERSKAGKQEAAAKVQRQPEKATLSSPDTKVEKKCEKILAGETVEPQEGADGEKGEGVLEKDGAAASPGMETEKPAQEVIKSTVVKSTPVKNIQKKGQVKPNHPIKLEENNSKLQPVFTVLNVKAEEEGSDVELSDNEAKEYFDDSTEERFNRQSSQSEESDDDFFVGKVSKFKKKKKKQEGVKEEKKVNKAQQEKSVDPGSACDKLQRELDELEARLKPKATSFQSVFCQSLARTKTGRGFDRRKGGGEIKDPEKLRAADRFRGDDLDRQFNKGQERSTSYSRSKFSEPWSGGRHPESQKMGGRGGGRGRGDARRGKDHRGGGGSSHQPLLHPSWEASKKRKEQQGQILAFQGKKIKFDDDDD